MPNSSAKMVSLKRKPFEESAVTAQDESGYPYGTVIHLEQDHLDALGADKFEVGDEVFILAKAKVISRSEREYEGDEPYADMGFQITDMELQAASTDRAKALYDQSD